MDKYKLFYNSIEGAVEKFKGWDKNETVRIISHLDADGISASSILIKVLNSENRKYSVSIVQQLNKEKIAELSKEPYKYIIFADLGSGQIKLIAALLKEKEIIILDHHEADDPDSESKIKDNKIKNIININPHLFGIDGSKEIAGSGIVYLFASMLNKKYEDLAHIAIIGAIGDIQEERGFLRLNTKILEKAVEKGKIEIKKGLRLFGMQTRPLHKVLQYSTDPFIPGISGSESGAIQFLNQIGINPKNGNEWKKIIHLNEEDMKKLVTGIIMKRFNETKPEDVLGNIYLLNDEEEESPTKDAKEFATLLNACGRMEKSSFGIGACLGIKKDKQKAIETLQEYRKEIVDALNLYNDNEKSINTIKGDRYIIINAEDKIPSTIIGTLASIITKSNDAEDGTYVLSMAQNKDSTTKVSLRIKGAGNKGINLKDILKLMISNISSGEAGGHMNAAGAVIPTEKEEEFLKIAEEILKQKALEEEI